MTALAALIGFVSAAGFAAGGLWRLTLVGVQQEGLGELGPPGGVHGPHPRPVHGVEVEAVDGANRLLAIVNFLWKQILIEKITIFLLYNIKKTLRHSKVPVEFFFIENIYNPFLFSLLNNIKSHIIKFATWILLDAMYYF